MKLTSTLALALVVTASYFVTSTVHADAYLRTQEIVSHQKSYIPDSHLSDFNPRFKELNDIYLGGKYGAYGAKHPLETRKDKYVRLPGREKRFGIFKLEKGGQDGSREDLVFDSKEEAQDFCSYMAKTLADEGKDRTVFVSDWIGGINQVIAVAYQVNYQGDLIPAKKQVFCPNHWNNTDNNYWNNPDPAYPDENDVNGVKASRFVNDSSTAYRVACLSSKPETTFIFRGTTFNRNWTNGLYIYQSNVANPRSLESMDAGIGNRYCTEP